MIKEQKVFERAYLVQGACEGLFTAREVAERLNLTIGHVFVLKWKYRKMGNAAFIHGNTGRTPANKTPDDIRAKIVELKTSETYRKANFNHFRQILKEDTGIERSYSAIRKILIAAGHKSPKTCRTKKQMKTHPLRERRGCFGEMLQADASPFDWFDNGEMESLHGYIDDATGTVTGLYIEKNECLLGYLEVTRQTIENYGIPDELYPDKASVFFVNKKDKENLTIEEQIEGLTEKKTQLGLIMEELGVNMHPAHSPQSKGRIERLWETLQSRLPIEFKRRGITTITAANEFLKEYYITIYNGEFTVKPANNKNHFVRLYDTSILDTLLVAKIQRKADNAGMFSFHNHKFFIPAPECRGKKIFIVMSEKIRFKAMLDKKLYEIQYNDFHDNRQTKTYMPDVTKKFINTYLKSSAKETAQSSGNAFLRSAAW